VTVPDSPDTAQEGRVEAFITQLTGARDGQRSFVSVVVRYGGKEARLQIESDATLIEQKALPEAVRNELAGLIDALEAMSESETPIAVRLGPVAVQTEDR
jgi:hypothetical protein